MRMAWWSVLASLVGALFTSGVASAQTAPPTAAPSPPPPPYAGSPPPPAGYPPGYYPAYPGYPPVAAYPPPLPPPPGPEKKLAIGYKIGNGLGFVGGDIIVSPVDHIALDFQVGHLDFHGATGIGYAPALVSRLHAGQVHTPYVALGANYEKITLGGDTDSAWGVFINAGYEWRWSQGVGIVVGGGLANVGELQVSSGFLTVRRDKGWTPNLEAGFRFAFL